MCRVLKVSRNGYYHWLRYGERREDPLLEQLAGSIFLGQDFYAPAPNMAYVGDITYISSGERSIYTIKRRGRKESSNVSARDLTVLIRFLCVFDWSHLICWSF